MAMRPLRQTAVLSDAKSFRRQCERGCQEYGVVFRQDVRPTTGFKVCELGSFREKWFGKAFGGFCYLLWEVTLHFRREIRHLGCGGFGRPLILGKSKSRAQRRVWSVFTHPSAMFRNFSPFGKSGRASLSRLRATRLPHVAAYSGQLSPDRRARAEPALWEAERRRRPVPCLERSRRAKSPQTSSIEMVLVNWGRSGKAFRKFAIYLWKSLDISAEKPDILHAAVSGVHSSVAKVKAAPSAVFGAFSLIRLPCFVNFSPLGKSGRAFPLRATRLPHVAACSAQLSPDRRARAEPTLWGAEAGVDQKRLQGLGAVRMAFPWRQTCLGRVALPKAE
jgi:hypothetical protein